MAARPDFYRAIVRALSRARSRRLRLVLDYRTLVGPGLLNVGGNDGCELRWWLTWES
jgi:hypothetical protein